MTVGIKENPTVSLLTVYTSECASSHLAVPCVSSLTSHWRMMFPARESSTGRWNMM